MSTAVKRSAVTRSPDVGEPPPGHPVPVRRLSTRAARAAAACLVVPALANVTYHLVTPVTSGVTSVAVAQAAAHPRLADVALLQFALPVLGVGVIVLAWLAAAVTPRLAAVAGGLLAGGYLLSALSIDGVLVAVAPGLIGQPAAVRLVDGYDGSLPGRLGTLLALGGQAPGLVLMGIVLWRSRLVPRWLALAFAATLPFHFLTHAGDSDRLPAASWGWYTLVLAGCGWSLVRGARLVPDPAADGVWSPAASGATMP